MPALAFSKMGSCLMGGGVSSWAELIGMQMVKILFLFYIDLCGRDKWYFYICVFGKWCPNRTCISLSEAIEQVLSEGVGFLNRPISGCPSRPTLLDSVPTPASLIPCVDFLCLLWTRQSGILQYVQYLFQVKRPLLCNTDLQQCSKVWFCLK